MVAATAKTISAYSTLDAPCSAGTDDAPEPVARIAVTPLARIGTPVPGEPPRGTPRPRHPPRRVPVSGIVPSGDRTPVVRTGVSARRTTKAPVRGPGPSSCWWAIQDLNL